MYAICVQVQKVASDTLELESQDIVSTLVLGTKLRSFRRIANALNHRATSAAHGFSLVCVFTCILMYICSYTCTWKPEIHVRYFSQCFPSFCLFFNKVSHWPGVTYCLDWLGSKPQGLLVLPSPTWELQVHTITPISIYF